MPYPIYRPRRLRESPLVRKMVRETDAPRRRPDAIRSSSSTAAGVREAIGSMPGQFRLSIDELAPRVQGRRRRSAFPPCSCSACRGTRTRGAARPTRRTGSSSRRCARSRRPSPTSWSITDVCLCEYTSHGHCGIVEDGRIRNDPTLELIARTALSHVEAGADMVAPSDMMDGRVAAIREALDESGYHGGADHGVLGQVRLGVLRAVPRGRRLHAAVRRPALATRWTPPTAWRPCARSPSTSTRARTS